MLDMQPLYTYILPTAATTTTIILRLGRNGDDDRSGSDADEHENCTSDVCDDQAPASLASPNPCGRHGMHALHGMHDTACTTRHGKHDTARTTRHACTTRHAAPHGMHDTTHMHYTTRHI